MAEAIDAVDGIQKKSSSDQISIITSYSDQAWEEKNFDFIIDGATKDITPASDIGQSSASSSASDVQTSLKNGVEVSSTTNTPSIQEQDNVIVINSLEDLEPDLFVDTDGDGTVDKNDATGKETQIEQAYDRDAAMATENTRAFLSLMSMFRNLDLTRFNSRFINGDSQSLAVQAAAGAAQVALMSTAQLQEFPQTAQAKREKFSQLVNQFRKQEKELKVKNLEYLAQLLDGDNPAKMLEMAEKMNIPDKQKQRLIENLMLLQKILPKPDLVNHSASSSNASQMKSNLSGTPVVPQD